MDRQREFATGYRSGIEAVLRMLNTGCEDGIDQCIIRITDCCEEPRWGCQTKIVLDGAGETDVTVCIDGYGCS